METPTRSTVKELLGVSEGSLNRARRHHCRTTAPGGNALRLRGPVHSRGRVATWNEHRLGPLVPGDRLASAAGLPLWHPSRAEPDGARPVRRTDGDPSGPARCHRPGGRIGPRCAVRPRRRLDAHPPRPVRPDRRPGRTGTRARGETRLTRTSVSGGRDRLVTQRPCLTCGEAPRS